MRLSRCTWFGAALAAAFVSAADGTPPRPAAPASQPAHPRGGVAYKNFYLPDSMGDRTARWFLAALDLNQDQQAIFDAGFRLYMLQDEGLRKDVLPDLWEQAARVSQAQQSAGIDDLFKKRAKFMQQAAAIEAAFFLGVEQMLGEHQLDALVRCQSYRKRQIARKIRSSIPGSNEDLSELLLEVQEELDTEPLDQAAYDTVLRQYEVQSTMAWERHAEALIEKILFEYDLFGPASQKRSAEVNMLAVEKFRKSNQEFVRMEERLAELNAQYLGLLSEQVPPAAAVVVVDRFNRAAFPQVYPDPYDATPALDCLIADASINPAVRQAIEQMRENYLANVSTASAAMVERHKAWTVRLQTLRTRDERAFSAYKTDMSALQAERAVMAEQVLSQTAALMVEMPPACAGAISEQRKRAAAHLPFEAGFSFKP